MSVSLSLARKPFFFGFIISCLFLTCIYVSPPAYADDRMAGSRHNLQRQHDRHVTRSRNHDDEWNAHYNAPSKDVLQRTESLGLYQTLHQGGLGTDLWYGSQRDDVMELMVQAPANTPYKTLNQLQIKLLLTSADTSLLSPQRAPRPHNDLLTARLNMMISKGLLSQATELYKEIPALPYSPQLAQAGITALFLNGESALACLETKSLQNLAPDDVAFWQQAERICNYILSNKTTPLADIPEAETTDIDETAAEEANESTQKPEQEEAKTDAENTVIAQILSGTTKHLKADNFEALEPLSNWEKAFLMASDKWNLPALCKSQSKPQDALLLSLCINQLNKEGKKYFTLFLHAVEDGYKPVSDLSALYISLKPDKELLKPDVELRDLWKALSKMDQLQQISALYNILIVLDDERKKADVLNRVFALKTKDTALYPFANFVFHGLKDTATDTAFMRVIDIYVQTGRPIPHDWIIKALSHYNIRIETAKEQDKAAIYAKIFNLMMAAGSQMKDISPDLYPPQSLILEHLNEKISRTAKKYYEKLDSSGNFAQYAAGNDYENPSGLTTESNYVMPSVDLLNRLTRTAKKKKTGETVLLGCQLLGEIQPNQLSAEVFHVIRDSLIYVGLTSDARKFTTEVMQSSVQYE